VLLRLLLPQDPKACTIVLRGASKDVLNEVERNLHVSGGLAWFDRGSSRVDQQLADCFDQGVAQASMVTAALQDAMGVARNSCMHP
jgi:hypothetical protein